MVDAAALTVDEVPGDTHTALKTLRELERVAEQRQSTLNKMTRMCLEDLSRVVREEVAYTLVREQYWVQFKDALSLPSGATVKTTVVTEMGSSSSSQRTMAAELGASVSASGFGLSASVNTKFSRSDEEGVSFQRSSSVSLESEYSAPNAPVTHYFWQKVDRVLLSRKVRDRQRVLQSVQSLVATISSLPAFSEEFIVLAGLTTSLGSGLLSLDDRLLSSVEDLIAPALIYSFPADEAVNTYSR